MISLIEFLTISSVATLTVAVVSQVFIRSRQSRRILSESSTRQRCDSESVEATGGFFQQALKRQNRNVVCSSRSLQRPGARWFP